MDLDDYGSRVGDRLLMAFGEPFQFLRLRRILHRYDKILKKVKFVNLRQLRLDRLDDTSPAAIDVLYAAAKTARKLKKLGVGMRDGTGVQYLMLIEEILKKSKRLCYIEIETRYDRDIPLVFACLEYGLEKLKGETFKINFTGNFHMDAVKVGGLKQIISKLATNVDNWMILLNSHSIRMDDLKKINAPISLDEESGYLVISNKGCNINGYSESWLMDE